jgi:hypothetical protein
MQGNKPRRRYVRALAGVTALLLAMLTAPLALPTAGGSAAAAVANPADTAIAWAQDFINHPGEHPDQYNGLCLAFVEAAYANAGVGMTAVGADHSAAYYWNQDFDSKWVHHTDLNPPVGALVFWDATPKAGYPIQFENPSGHVGIFIGNNKVISTNAFPQTAATGVFTFPLTGTGSRVGYPYLGWIAPAGTAPTPPPPPPPAFTYPKDGTFVQLTGTPQVYRIAGGAPIYVSTWKAVGLSSRPAVTMLSAANFAKIHAHVLDGTFIRGRATGKVYRMAGGAPIYVTSAGWHAGLQSQATSLIDVDQAAIDHAGGSGVWSHILQFPVNGTELVTGTSPAHFTHAYIVQYSIITVLYDTPLFAGEVEIDPASASHAGQSGVWSHLWQQCGWPTSPSAYHTQSAVIGQTQTSCGAAIALTRYAATNSHGQSLSFTDGSWRCVAGRLTMSDPVSFQFRDNCSVSGKPAKVSFTIYGSY